MPIYVFHDDEGNEYEVFFNASEVPSIGQTIDGDGKVLTRVPSFILDSAGIERKTHKYPYVSRSLPRNLAGAESNNKGQPIIRSQSHERDVAARHDMEKE
tara:strand:- start:997 stop:1296 length:300 start_codon:yes stop_codon:yes gene_type:complete